MAAAARAERSGESGRTRRPAWERAAAMAPRKPARDAAAGESGAALHCHKVARLVAGYYEVPPAALFTRTRRSRQQARARHVAIYIAHVTLGLPRAAVGTAFRRDGSTVAYACRVIEDMRDNPAFDAALANLEMSAAILFQERQRIAA